MKEIGGYIELDTYTGKMLHEDGVKLNCGRNALAYILSVKKIKKLWMPKFMCDSCDKVLSDNEIEIQYYTINSDFKPQIDKHTDWLYVVNFYGQLSNTYLASLGEKVIIDNAQAYFQKPIAGMDTLYTCRKFFGVADGAILYTDKMMTIDEQDESFGRMHFLLGRYERSASEFYSEYVENNQLFKNEPIKRMSRLTYNLLHALNYEMIKSKRTENFSYLQNKLADINKLRLSTPEGAFMYPFYHERGSEIRKKLQAKKIFIPTLWPAVFNRCKEDELEYDMAKNILPLPVDQRYNKYDMQYIYTELMRCISD